MDTNTHARDGYSYTLPEAVTFSAYHHIDDGQTWLRVKGDDGSEYDEPISGWELVHDLTAGRSHYRHSDGRKYDSL